jgi:hypothetical protein
MQSLISKAKNTDFGKDHHFYMVSDYESFKENIPIKHYEDYKYYLNKVLDGEENILWPNPYKYLLKTSKTTGDVEDKFIPLSKESIKNLVSISFISILNFAVRTKNYSIIIKRGLYLTASPKLERKGKYPYALLSGVTHYLKPKILRNFGLPSFETNITEDWNLKLEKIEYELKNKDLGIIVGTPPWINILIKKIYTNSGIKLEKYFKDLSLFIFGGAPINLYRNEIKSILGDSVTLLETYPASEGFIGYQDQFPSEELLLQTCSGIFFEFIKKEDYYRGIYTRVMLSDIAINQDYALVLNTDSGLFGYLVGDIIKFSSKIPARFKITGRLLHHIKFNDIYYNDGELSIPLTEYTNDNQIPLGEFTFSPSLSEKEIDFYYETKNDLEIKMDKLHELFNLESTELNLIHIKEGSSYQYMKNNYKVGGQYKITRIRNDRRITDYLIGSEI